MNIKFYSPDSLTDISFTYAVIAARYRDRWIFCRRCDRSTWEIPGGHVEAGESPDEAARRELYEESGAAEFTITRGFDYWAGDASGGANGAVFLADITRLDPLPQSEMAEVHTFDALPEKLTYPDITPVLWAHAREAGLL